MEAYQYIRILLKRWWLIALLVVVSTASAIYYNSQQLPVYRSTVILLLTPAPGQDSLLPYSLSERTGQLAQTYAMYLKTRAFAELVIEREGLNISAGALVGAINAQVIEGTQFFEITARANEPEQAQLLATAIANSFIAENLAQQQREMAARRSASDVGNASAILREKLEREQTYYEDLVDSLRTQVAQVQSQPPSAARDELLSDMQARLSEYETRLVQIMSDRVAMQPRLEDNQINTVTIVEPAPLPTQPENTENTQNLLFAIAAGLVIGATLAFGLEYLDYTVKSPVEIEQLTGQPPLGVLGVTEGDGDNGKEYHLVVLENPRSPTAEAFRALRTNLLFSQVDDRLRSLVITSAGPGEGKTTVAANLAVTLAHSGQRVILVDADLRRPNQHRIFGLSTNYGLSNLILAENATDPEVLKEYLQPGPVENLRILTCGPIPHNPAELLSAKRATAIFEALEADADTVIYDTPPALTVTDAVILARRTNATLPIIHAGSTRRDVVEKLKMALERVGATVLAPVLNRVKVGDVGYYHYYYYSGKYYGESSKRKRRSKKGSFDLVGAPPQIAPTNGAGKHTARNGQADRRNGEPAPSDEPSSEYRLRE